MYRLFSGRTAAVLGSSVAAGTAIRTLCLCDDDEALRYNQALVSMRHSDLPALKELWTRKYATPSKSWPPRQPDEEEIPHLRSQLKACRAGQAGVSLACAEHQFDLATALLATSYKDEAAAKEGANMYRELASRGHGDSMVGLGVCLRDGRGVASKPGEDDDAAGAEREREACAWFAEAAHGLGHPQALYELAVALYTGAGVPEDEREAARLFELSAHKSCGANDCHAGALYMFGDCLLEGVGLGRDRARALGALRRAGELGHRGARSRLLALLDPPSFAQGLSPDQSGHQFSDASRQSYRRPPAAELGHRRATEALTTSPAPAAAEALATSPAPAAAELQKAAAESMEGVTDRTEAEGQLEAARNEATSSSPGVGLSEPGLEPGAQGGVGSGDAEQRRAALLREWALAKARAFDREQLERSRALASAVGADATDRVVAAEIRRRQTQAPARRWR